jgi:hypothetical protein
LPVGIAGEVLIAGEISVGADDRGQRVLRITPVGTQLHLLVPMNDGACKAIGGQLLARNIVVPQVRPGT